MTAVASLPPAGTVDVVWVDLATVDTEAWLRTAPVLLSGDEVHERGRALSAEVRMRSWLSRVFLRTTLGWYLQEPPAALIFTYGENGRPSLEPRGGPAALSFNVSHSGTLLACAVSRHPVLGLDVERVDRRLDLEGVARLSFSPAELIGFYALAGDQRRERFFALWTLKEAYLKARGAGLTLPLDRFSLSLGADDVATVRFDAGFGDDETAWSFARPDLGSPIRAAVAVRDLAGIPLRTRTVPYELTTSE